jgi:hypothetical protein
MQVVLVMLVGVTAACGLSNGLQEYVVHFTPGTPTAVARAAGEACPRFGAAQLEPPDRGNLATSRAYPVRYDITKASSQDKAALLDCLKKQKFVRGVSDTNEDS